MEGKVTGRQENNIERVLATVCPLFNCIMDKWRRSVSNNSCTIFINNVVSWGLPFPRADNGRHIFLRKTDNHMTAMRRVHGSVHIVTVSHNTLKRIVERVSVFKLCIYSNFLLGSPIVD